MNQYSSVGNALESLFSVEVGLSDEDAFTLFDRMLARKDYRDNFEAELRALFADPSVSWMVLLENQHYCVYHADDEDDAKKFFIELIWNRVFPMQTPPEG